MRFLFIIVVFIFHSTQAQAIQNNQDLLFRILDSESKRPVPYATVRFVNNKNGVIANLKGDFSIPIRYKNEKDVLIISCIGYTTKRVPLESLVQNEYYAILLIPKTEQLSEVVLNSIEKKKLRASQIVKKSIENIILNNPVLPFTYIAYYRDYQIVEDEYINLNEGIVEAFDQGFLSHKISDSLNKTALYSYELNPKFIQDTLLSYSFYNDSKQIKDGKMGSSIGNELTLLNIHDPIRNFNTGSFSFVYTLEKNFIYNHKFFKKGSIFLDDEELYKIEFSAKEKTTGPTYKANGFIYISKDDFSIHKFGYHLYSNRPDKLIFSVDIEYKRRDNQKMYLNYITFNNNFFITQNDALQIENWFYDKEKESFFIVFNRVLDIRSIEKINSFKIFFKDKKLKIQELLLATPKIIKVKFEKEISDFLNEQNLEEKALISLDLKNVIGIRGYKMGESEVEGYQFRELFIQEIFEDRKPPFGLTFLNKALPMSEAEINRSDFDINKYWINSPLKQSKGEDE